MKKRIAILAMIILALAMLFACGKEESEVVELPPVEMALSVDESSTSCLINGTVSLTNAKGDYSIYFGDEAGKPLSGYTRIGVASKDTPYTLSGAIVPPYARTIVVVRENESAYAPIPDEYLLDADDAYIFGALSDVHYGKYEDAAIYSFDLALDYFENIGADLVAIAGDLSNAGEVESYEKYNAAIANRPYPVFTVTGNHDETSIKSGIWAEYITSGITGVEFGPNGMDFIYAPEGLGGDVFIFLNQQKWLYTVNTSIITAEQILWLRDKLEYYKDVPVYLFFHSFLCGPDGQKHTGVGNIMNPGGYTYPIPYYYNNSDERMFRKMLKQYKNVVFFSGHSHWAFEMEKYGEQANFSNFDGEYCTMVHVPSVTEPRVIGDYDTDRWGLEGQSSQGWAVYDYGDVVVMVPVDFITGVHYTEYMEILN